MSEALKSFLDGEALETVVTPSELIQGKEAHFYGNIGRCLFLTSRCESSSLLYKAAQLLEESCTHSDRLNKATLETGLQNYWYSKGNSRWQRLRIELLCACGMIALLLELLKREIGWISW